MLSDNYLVKFRASLLAGYVDRDYACVTCGAFAVAERWGFFDGDAAAKPFVVSMLRRCSADNRHRDVAQGFFARRLGAAAT